jgi:nicotinate-nucleotide--dimethylbenzimidazole phosphoribosyltransferase
MINPLAKEMELEKELLQKIDLKTKPPGSLGRLEEIALQTGLLQKTLNPRIYHPHILVFAGDHGITQTGLVNPYPQSVTGQMVLNFIHGGAAINTFCNQHRLDLIVVDAGVNFDFDPALSSKSLIQAKIGHGTRNYLEGPAMSLGEAEEALLQGARILDLVFKRGCNCVGLGEMGIGNSSSASLIMSALTRIPIEECVGRGTGANDLQLKTKTETLKKAFELHFPPGQPNPSAREILSRVGGFEIAMMVGAYLRAAELNMLIVVDGFISTAALLLALAIDPKLLTNCIFAHTSGERGHARLLEMLGAKPLLNLDLRLGEGTGSALAIPLIQSAINFLNEMASFDSAGVSNKQ